MSEETHAPGFLPGDTADTYRWILVPSATVETLGKPYASSESESARAGMDIVARWDSAEGEEIEL